MKTIVLTGGGTAGHVTPHFALLEDFKNNNINIEYIGSKDGIEKALVEAKGIPYHAISSGKLRRYFDVKNLTDPFRIIVGVFQSVAHLLRIKPALVFSKGGFVTVPVVMAAWLLRIPVVIHESDMTPGLANKLSKPFARKILVTFEETLKHVTGTKGVYTGSPVRRELGLGDADRGYAFTGFTADKPVLMMMGGSIGAQKINEVLRKSLPELLKHYQIIHLCGKDNMDHSLDSVSGYRQYEFVSDELKDLFAITDMMLSRAGSNAINEFLFLKIPSLLIPLSLAASRGDQIQNARAFAEKHFSLVLEEEYMTPETLTASINDLYEHRETYLDAMNQNKGTDGAGNVMKVLLEYLS